MTALTMASTEAHITINPENPEQIAEITNTQSDIDPPTDLPTTPVRRNKNGEPYVDKTKVNWSDYAECLRAVAQDGWLIKRVLVPHTEELCLTAVKQNGLSIRACKVRTPAVVVAAVWKDPRAIAFIKRPNEKLAIMAVQKDGRVLEHVHTRTPAIVAAAIKRDASAIRFVGRPKKAICLLAVQRDGMALRYIKEQTLAVQFAAVKQNGMALQYVTPIGDYPISTKVQYDALTQNGLALQYVKEPNIKHVLLALAQNPQAGQFVSHVSFKLWSSIVADGKIDTNALMQFQPFRATAAAIRVHTSANAGSLPANAPRPAAPRDFRQRPQAGRR